MKTLVLYRPNSEHGRLIDEFIHNFQSRYPDARLEVQNIDTRDGMATASLYGVMQYPAIMVLQNDGFQHKSWEGDRIPLVDEVMGYARG